MLTTVYGPCETALSPFEDRFADVSTSAPVSGGREARARLSFFWRIGCSVLEWKKNIAAFADRHRVYAFDMLGHGLTDKPRKNCYAIADLARFTLAFLSVQGEDSAHFIGSSAD